MDTSPQETGKIASGRWSARLAAALICALLTLAGGCVSAAQRQAADAVNLYFVGDPAGAADRLRPLAAKTDQDFVLNNVRLGSAALASYDVVEAEAAFLRAYEVINSFGVNRGGRTIGAVLVDEKIRIWKGEPFERAMANFYLGLIYYAQHDYGNARGALENALFKLRDYGESANDYREVESNFVLATIMLARSWQRLGRDDLAGALFDQVRAARPDLAALADPQVHQRSNLLLIVEFGYGPRKLTTGGGSTIGFGPTAADAGPSPRPEVLVDGQAYAAAGLAEPTVDLLALAQDRRWQSIDTIRAIKAALGTGLLYGGAGYGIYKAGQSGSMRDEEIAISLGMIASGLALRAASQADVRQWEMLPRTVFILPLSVSPGRHDVTVRFPDSPGLSQTWTGIEVPERGEATHLFRASRLNSGSYQWPPPALAAAQEH